MTATPNGVHGRPLTGPRNMKPTTSRPAASPVKHASRQQSSTKPHLTPQTREWWTCTEVKLRITGLPKSAKTSDLYKLFKSQGHIVRIELFENRKAERTQDGQMIFSPPPKEPFWEKSPFDCVSFRDGQISQIPYRLYFTLVDSKRNLKIQSSVDPGRQLKETMVRDHIPRIEDMALTDPRSCKPLDLISASWIRNSA